MSRAYRSRNVLLTLHLTTGQSRQGEDFEYPCHSNETWGHIRRVAFNRFKSSFGIMELYRGNGEIFHPSDDNKTLAQTDQRDRISVNVRWVQMPNQACSSGESSSSDSEINHNMSSAHQSRLLEPVDSNAESSLPSVIFSHKHEYYQFLFEISDLGCRENHPRLRDIPRSILELVPVDQQIKTNFTNCFQSITKCQADDEYQRWKTFYLIPSPTQMLYHLKVTLIKLSPIFINQDQSNIDGLHVFFLNTGGLICLLDILTDKRLIEHCDMSTKKSIYFIIFYILKRFFAILGFYQLRPNIPNDSLEQSLASMPLSPPYTEQQTTISFEKYLSLILQKHDHEYPIPKKSFLTYKQIIEFIRLIWCLASNNQDISFEQDFLQIHQTFKQDDINEYDIDDDGSLACREALELLCLSLALVPSSVENLMNEEFFEYFLFDILLYCQYPNIRQTASDQIYILTTRCSQDQTENLLKYLIKKQFQMFDKYSNDLKQYSLHSLEFFLLLCRLLSFASNTQVCLGDLDQQLDDEIRWLKNVQLPIDDHLLYGHLSLAKELLQFQSSDRKRFYGIDQSLIQQLIQQYLFPASTLLYQYRSLKQENNVDIELKEPPVPICQLPMTTSPAFDVLVSLATNCLDNFKLIDRSITDLFYSIPDSNLNEWDYSLPFGPRSNRGFVGLKNASATCYMNSVLQQLFMIEPLRSALLSVKIPSEYCRDDADDDDMRRDNFENLTDAKAFLKDNQSPVSPPKDRNEYNIQILRQIQRIFGHLLDSKLQFYIPKEFWKIFKFAGEPVNLRDQQDAVEFLNTLVDNLDEALKALQLPQICSLVLGGQFADQKICKDCPHRYTREEDFTLLSVDIRHSQNLQSSLELYVQGELLDGPNAYFCEKCNKKVDTIKRTCFKKLPTILAIQLKRFDYDWERETPIKFNDYFEFPRELDMEPYTVQGLAKAEGTPVIEETPTNDSTRYKLVGIIVHRGQANGGHYYSFIQHKDESEDHTRWYLFDDTDVSESRMDDDEELRSNCFGGENSGSSFDQPIMKRKSRWWNAYILFYEKIPNDQSNLETKLSQLQLHEPIQRMPLSVQRSVRMQNIKFLHNRILFSAECFSFIKKLVQSNVQHILSLQQVADDKNIQTIEETALICIQVAMKFLFSFGWRAKKMLRGPANEWTENVNACLRLSSKARAYLAEEVLFKHPNRFQEYLIDCTAADVRASLSRILYHLAIYSRPEDPTSEKMNIEDTVLFHIIRLLKKDIPENVKSLTQYFIFFMLYSQAGRHKCENLIRFNVPIVFANLAVDDLTTSSMRLNEPTKLSIILSTLIRCFDTSNLCKSKDPEHDVLPNRYGTFDTPICPIPTEIIDILYRRENFLKKVLEDATSCEDSARLLRFLLWENPDITSIIFNEIVGLLSVYYTNDLHAHLELVRMVLTIEDSWQEARILYALKGIPILSSSTTTTITNNNNNNQQQQEVQQSLFDIFSKSKSSYQKRAYQCLKMLQTLFTNCEKANHILQTDSDIKEQWIEAVHWLRDQLERPNSMSSNYTYYQSTGQVHSNDSPQGYHLERTPSARSVLEKASELCSDRENDAVDDNSDEIEDDDEPIEPLHRSQP